jgi:hypothetical protein
MSLEHCGAMSPMPRSTTSTTLVHVATLALALLPALLACTDGDARERERLLDSRAVRQLVGTWDVSFTTDRHASITSPPGVVTGTLAFTADHHGPASTEELRDLTHQGSYDLDFRPFGWTTRGVDALAVAVARVGAAQRERALDAVPDSLFIVLSPGTERFAVRMAGTFAGDSAWGRWRARAYSAGGGEGRFVMRRHAN